MGGRLTSQPAQLDSGSSWSAQLSCSPSAMQVRLMYSLPQAGGLALQLALLDGASSSTRSSMASLVATPMAALRLSQLPSTTCARSSQLAGPSTLWGISSATCSTRWMRPSSTSSTTLLTLSTRSRLCFPAGLAPKLTLRRRELCWDEASSSVSAGFKELTGYTSNFSWHGSGESFAPFASRSLAFGANFPEVIAAFLKDIFAQQDH